MNRKITIRIVLIITVFLILSSSLFAEALSDPVGMLEGLFEELFEAIRMFFLMVIIILILIIAGVVNYSYNKEKEKYRDYYSLMNASDNEELKRLLENGIDINAKDGDGWTALMDASNKGNLEIAKYLLENGADINSQSNTVGLL